MSSHALLTAAAAGSLLLTTLSGAQQPVSPPGLKLIEGTRVKVGAKVKDIQALIEANEYMAPALVSETPMHSSLVDDFWLMISEVTNEQYAAYVGDTGSRPPHTWGEDSIEEARMAWFEEERQKKEAAESAGERYIRGEPFDGYRWWEKNWVDRTWDVPKQILNHPVNYVDFEDARNYARWAGLRLMTEFEFQCAARGKTEDTYPWGDTWDPKAAACIDAGRDTSWAIGSFPAGAREGIFDLAGNAWEWTSSPYVKFPGYKLLTLTIGQGKQRRKLDAMALWDANARVVVGGSFNMGEMALRVTTRRNTVRTQRTAALGFRCAMSTKPGRDLAEVVWTEMIPGEVLPEDLDYLHEQPTILHRWTSSRPVGEQGDATESSPANPRLPEGYEVITGYDAVLFLPARQVDAINVKAFKEVSLEKLQHFGILYTSRPLMVPELRPGPYMLAFRAGGPLAALEEGAEAPAWHSAPGFIPEQDSYLFFDPTGEPVSCVPAQPLLYDRIKARGSIRWEAWVPPEPVEVEKGEEPPPPPVPKDLLRLRINVPGRQRNKGFLIEITLYLKPGIIDESWSSK